MAKRTNPEAFAPGEYIREELEARGWTQLDLAEIVGRPAQAVNEVITGKRAITPDMANALGEAFGTSAQVWMNLESSYQLAKVSAKDDSIGRKAKLYEIAPLKDMQKRGWIERSTSIDVVETQVMAFYSIDALDQPIRFHHAARKSTDYGKITAPQLAWLYRARNLARAVGVTGRFSDDRLAEALEKLSHLVPNPEEIRRIPQVLAESGIRFLVVEQLPHTRIDGVCFWLDADSPVVALSVRYDRIDWFWHTLLHEMAHVKRRDGMENPTLDMDIVGSEAQPFDQKPEAEQYADRFAAQFLVNQKELDKFIARIHPLYSKVKIAAFAHKLRTHPGIVVGQLQFRDKISFAHSREFLVRIRGYITDSALTDGWGEVVWLKP